MSKKLRIQPSPSKEDDSYAEDDFELDSVGGSNKFSPKKAASFELRNSKENQFKLKSEEVKGHGTQQKHEEEEDEMSGDLERYIMEMKINPAPIHETNEDDEQALDENKVTQSLEGVKPSTENSEHQQLGEKLGYHERPLTNILSENNHHYLSPKPEPNHQSNHQHHQSNHQLDYHQIRKSPHPRAGNQNHSSPRTSQEEEEEHANEAQKVESLLSELFPDKYGKKKPTKAKKSGSKLQQLNSMAPGVAAAAAYKLGLLQDDEDDTPDQAKDVLSTLDGQLKLLKKELRVKDEKIAKLTEHSVMMANHMDRLKGEIAKLHAKLKDAEVEIEAKDARLAEALKAKKKVKKIVQKSSPVQDRSLAGLEAENIKLREREQALMEAVEELSSQNEDLIVKLRESMQRELELSSKRAALVSHSVMNHGNSSSLPNIHDKEYHYQGGYAEQRTQSEPSSSDAPLKRGKKAKTKGNHY